MGAAREEVQEAAEVRVGRKAISGSLFVTQVMRLVGWHILAGITHSGLFLCAINPRMVRTGSGSRGEDGEEGGIEVRGIVKVRE